MKGRVLHLFANHKVTGPAELALETVRALCAHGVPASFYSSDVKRTRYRDRWLQLLANEREIPTAPLEGVTLGKHYSPVRAFFDVRRLARHLAAEPPRLIHCHLPGDHIIAGAAVRRSGLDIPVVRTLYDGEAPPPTRRQRQTLGRAARLICHSAGVCAALKRESFRYRIDPSRLRVLSPPIDVRRFDPGRGIPARRQALGVPAEAFCLGIVARMQTHRRFELLLEAIERARGEVPELHVVVVGRGTNQVSVAKDPVQQMGLSEVVHFPGYISGEDYVGTLASFDAKVFLVPGSDGTCRAVREALAMGVPVITTRRGMLPELVREGVDGLCVEETVESLSGAIVRLAREPEQRADYAGAAREGAVERFAYEALAARLEAIYAELG